MKKRDLLSIADLSSQEIGEVLRRSAEGKRGNARQGLAGKTVALLFEKPSLRTRVSFEVAVGHLGGHAVYLGREEVGLGTREPVADVARVLSRYVSAIVARVYAHKTLEDLAAHAAVPVINALSDREHPCQALADLLTVQERLGRLEGVNIAFIGDGNNVACSLALAAASEGASFAIASPAGYELPNRAFALAARLAAQNGATVRRVRHPQEAAQGAHVLYTDVWVSMGQEAEREQRRRDFQGYQVNSDLLRLAHPGAVVMHPMPAHYGEELASGMEEHPQSAIYDQAENRLHAQKAVLAFLLEGASP
ncbi:MAG: ornithine carbamoyltransferase [Chloroflexi bacterium]|nr:ornithine carbamoyltransferase [Chloroflexota bacterium]